MNQWFRSWHGAPTDSKWLLIAKRAGTVPGVVSAVVWALFDHASQHEDRGTVSDFDVETYSTFSGFDEDNVAAVITAMTEKGLIKNGRLTAWEKRQPKREDSSAERAKEWRERKRTQPNANEHREDKSREDKKERKRDARASVAPDFQKFKESYPKRGASNPWQPASQLFEQAVRAGHDPGMIIAAAKTYAAECDRNKTTGTDKVAQAQTWLRQARFLDYVATTNPTMRILAPYSEEWEAERLAKDARGERTDFMKAQAEKGNGWPAPALEAAE